MRFAVSLGWCGYALDFSVGPMCDDEPEPEFEPYQDAGSTGCTVIGFAPPVVPFGEMDCPPHQWEPDDDGENP